MPERAVHAVRGLEPRALSAEEAVYIDLKARLATGLRERRRRRSLTQADLAKRLQSSQSRIAKMEAGDPSVSLDLLIRSLLILGTSRRELSLLLARPSLPHNNTSGALHGVQDKVNVLANDADPEGAADLASAVIVTGNANLGIVAGTVFAGGAVTFTPPANTPAGP